MSANKLISIKNPIIDAIDMLGLDHHQDMPVFTRWASLAEKEINSYFQYIRKHTVLDITNCTACLPQDAKYVQWALLGDLGCDCGDIMQSLCARIPLSSSVINASTTGTFLVVDMGSGYSSFMGCIPFVLQNNKMLFDQNLNGRKITIQYLGYQMDDEGFLMIGENHVQAIMWNIIWKYYFRKRNKSSGVEYGMMNQAREEWNRECSNARAKDNELTPSERHEISRILFDPYFGQGCEIGMATTLDGHGW